MHRCEIGLGGNQGDVVSTLRRSLELLTDAGVLLKSVSRFYRTKAVGDRAESDFINAAASIETDMAPIALMDRLQSIEMQLGRVREIRWGPRTLDLDLLFYGDEQIWTPRLIVPHPACWYRRFVLDPLCDIAPQRTHPARCVSVLELRRRLLGRPLSVAFAGVGSEARRRMIDRLRDDFASVRFAEWHEESRASSPSSMHEPALIFCLEGDNSYGNRGYDALPPVARLNVPSTPDDIEPFVRHVLQSALDEPLVCD